MHDKIAHTAEHAFIGSLQRRLGRTLQVRKVEHKKSGSTAIIVLPDLELQTVFGAQADVNSLIVQGRKVTERMYRSIEEARTAAPGLRANEMRISGEVRVVEIENHDLAACAMEHADNLRECGFFLVTRLSKNGGEYEVDFVVAQQAKAMATLISEKLMRVCGDLGANINTVENTAKKLKAELESTRLKLRSHGSRILEGMPEQKVGRFMLLAGAFSNLDDDQVVEFAGEKISANENMIVLVSNAGPESAKIVFSRNERMVDIDCSELFKHAARDDGRGGGKPHFVTGIVKKDSMSRVFDEITNEIRKRS